MLLPYFITFRSSLLVRQAFRRFLVAALLPFAIVPLHAQQEAAQIATQQDLMNREGAQTLPPSSQYRITDTELGEIDLVARTPKPKMFTFSTVQSLNYTSNAFLVNNGEQDAFFWNGRFDASIVPYSVRDITPRLTFEQNFFRYTRFSQLDFDSQTLQLDVKFDLNRSDTWFVNTSYGVTRLYAPHGSAGEFYRYGLANVNLNHYRPLGPVYLLATAGVYSRHGESSAFDRIVPYLSAAALYSPIENVQLSAFVRPELQFYTNDPIKSSRTDFNVSVGTTAAWTPIQYVSIGATLALVGNYSNSGVQEYNVFSPSVVVGAQISF
jgi:hypothetical protein